MMLPFFLIGLDAFLLVTFTLFALLLPALTRRDLLFGVTVAPNTRATSAGSAIVRGYRVGVVALMAAVASALAVLWLLAPAAWSANLWITLIPLALALLPDIPYLFAYRAARRLAGANPSAVPATQPAPDTAPAPRHYGEYVPWLWETLPLALVALTVAYLATTYAAAPAIIPTHFDAAGVANAYARKSIGSYFIMVWVQLFMEVFLLVLAVLIAGTSSVPGQAGLVFRRRALRFLYFVRVLSIAFVGVLAVLIAQASLGAHSQIGLPLLLSGIFVLLVVGGAMVLAISTGQGGARIGPAAETATDRLDDRHWWLGAIYANRNDPAIFVEHRFGVGWTLNFGNPRALAVMVCLLALPVLLVLLIEFASPH